MSEHISADQLDRYADAATAQLRAERDDARRQMQSLTEDYVAMEARAVKAEATVREQADQLDTLRNAIERHRRLATSTAAGTRSFADNTLTVTNNTADRELWSVLAAAGGGVPEEGA